MIEQELRRLIDYVRELRLGGVDSPNVKLNLNTFECTLRLIGGSAFGNEVRREPSQKVTEAIGLPELIAKFEDFESLSKTAPEPELFKASSRLCEMAFARSDAVSETRAYEAHLHIPMQNEH